VCRVPRPPHHWNCFWEPSFFCKSAILTFAASYCKRPIDLPPSPLTFFCCCDRSIATKRPINLPRPPATFLFLGCDRSIDRKRPINLPRPPVFFFFEYRSIDRKQVADQFSSSSTSSDLFYFWLLPIDCKQAADQSSSATSYLFYFWVWPIDRKQAADQSSTASGDLFIFGLRPIDHKQAADQSSPFPGLQRPLFWRCDRSIASKRPINLPRGRTFYFWLVTDRSQASGTLIVLFLPLPWPRRPLYLGIQRSFLFLVVTDRLQASGRSIFHGIVVATDQPKASGRSIFLGLRQFFFGFDPSITTKWTIDLLPRPPATFFQRVFCWVWLIAMR